MAPRRSQPDIAAPQTDNTRQLHAGYSPLAAAAWILAEADRVCRARTGLGQIHVFATFPCGKALPDRAVDRIGNIVDRGVHHHRLHTGGMM